MSCHWEYERLKEVLKKEQLPAMVVDLDCLDENISRISKRVSGFRKKMRIASKSVRVPWLLDYIIKKGGSHFQGLMCFSLEEAAFLASLGFDDLLIAYPTVSPADMERFYALTQKGIRVYLMVDSAEQVRLIQQYWQGKINPGIPAKVFVDVDMSWKPAGLHLGVHRSSIRSLNDFKALYQVLEATEQVSFAGLMGYEAQVAGMGDKSPFSSLLNPAKKFIKKRSVRDVYLKREEIAAFLNAEQTAPYIFNGGGTGSLKTSGKESCLTEVTAGSGFLQSHLFDYYQANENVPAFCFALQVSRRPQPGMVTCKSGGFIASGDVGADKWPIPFLPKGMKLVKNEGFGEVQTPVQIPKDVKVDFGDALFFRPAKAGEIAERFEAYILIRGNEIVDKVPTYRGLGQCFY